jgi:endonuclease/exonuclease/phosphatase family metal-dependent hydrolase
VHKGYLIARIDTGSAQYLTIINAHLQASYVKDDLPTRQLTQLIDMYTAAKEVAADDIVVLCGDLNIDALIPRVYRETCTRLHPLRDVVPQEPTVTCVYNTATCKEVSTTTHMCKKCATEYATPSLKYTVVNQRLDHIWVSPRIRVVQCNIVNSLVLSDHYGVEATLIL